MHHIHLPGKKVFITGAAAGIGLETAKYFVRAKAEVFLTDLDETGLNKSAELLRALGGQCQTAVLDVTDEVAFQTLADTLCTRGDTPDVLINNAGIGYLGDFVHTPMHAWRRVIDINLMGVVYGCAFFLPYMQKAGGKRSVVNIASAAGYTPIGGLSAYVASKHAVKGLTDTLAIEWAQSMIRFTLVCPGIINTAIVQVKAGGALTADNISATQIQHINDYYQQHGCHASVVAEAIVKAVEKGSSLITPGPTATSGYFASRLVPRSIFLKACEKAAKQLGYLYSSCGITP